MDGRRRCHCATLSLKIRTTILRGFNTIEFGCNQSNYTSSAKFYPWKKQDDRIILFFGFEYFLSRMTIFNKKEMKKREGQGNVNFFFTYRELHVRHHFYHFVRCLRKTSFCVQLPRTFSFFYQSYLSKRLLNA